MKKPLSRLISALLFIAAPIVLAGSSTELAVKGQITPSACTPDLSDSGTIDFGKISAKDLYQNIETRLQTQTLQLTVNCEASALFAFRMLDNRAGSATGNGFGLGMINAGQKLGRYDFNPREPVADVPSTLLLSFGHRWVEIFDSFWLGPSDRVALGSRQSDGNWAPHPVKSAAITLVLNTYIAAAKDLTLTEEVPIDGLATLELQYL
ncbi:hypothetical protein AO262_30400 [Pseudomonas fluorescens ABAC62]|nr:hypothetical protein AO262_30400 [Pseudomonas fluorescens ABAC62]